MSRATYECAACRLYWPELTLEDEYQWAPELADRTTYDRCPQCFGRLEMCNDGSEPGGLPDGAGPYPMTPPLGGWV